MRLSCLDWLNRLLGCLLDRLLCFLFHSRLYFLLNFFHSLFRLLLRFHCWCSYLFSFGLSLPLLVHQVLGQITLLLVFFLWLFYMNASLLILANLLSFSLFLCFKVIYLLLPFVSLLLLFGIFDLLFLIFALIS